MCTSRRSESVLTVLTVVRRLQGKVAQDTGIAMGNILTTDIFTQCNTYGAARHDMWVT